MVSDSENITSFTLPTLPEHHLPRINHVKWLHDRLSNERKVIVVKGSEGAGKTTLLSEFVHFYKDQCFSFFIGSDTWSSSSHLFLHEMCDQMSRLLNENSKSLETEISNVQLKQYFITLYHRVAKLARHNNTSYYFVVDGLDPIRVLC